MERLLIYNAWTTEAIDVKEAITLAVAITAFLLLLTLTYLQTGSGPNNNSTGSSSTIQIAGFLVVGIISLARLILVEKDQHRHWLTLAWCRLWSFNIVRRNFKMNYCCHILIFTCTPVLNTLKSKKVLICRQSHISPLYQERKTSIMKNDTTQSLYLLVSVRHEARI